MIEGAFRWWLDCAAFAGILVLAVPTWSLNLRKKKLQHIRDAARESPSAGAFRDQVRAILSIKRERDVGAWRRIDEVCLTVGYLLLLGSAALRLLLPYFA
ncbi:MAG: hypothetical protein KDE35_11500 [Geminicoccaceae bacterium]|nr:hypothetical protein [Geminicoccaceae bacterium]